MNIEDINNLTNDLLVARLECVGFEEAIEKLIEDSGLKQKLEETQTHRNDLQGQLLEAMQSNNLKSWKVENCSVSRAKRETASCDPSYKKAIESKLKDGEAVEGWNLNVTEYISIRTT